MATIRPRVCNDCMLLLSAARAPRIITYRSISTAINNTSRQHSQRQQLRRYATITPSPITIQAQDTTPIAKPQSPSDLNETYGRVEELAASVLRPTDGPVPSEQRTLFVYEQLDGIARSLLDADAVAAVKQAQAPSFDNSATSALLGSVNTKRFEAPATKTKVLELIASSADEMVRDPNVFITAPVLKTYVELKALLQRPATLVEAFDLYATKPTPKANSDGTVTLIPSKINHVSSAVDRDTANTALNAAVSARDMPLALEIVETSFGTIAYRRAKTLRQCAIPGLGLAFVPFVAYGLSSQFAAWQNAVDPSQATMMAFAGMMTYVSVVGGVGYVAVTTANDQMDRVTWAQGVPLWERWVREDERAALDRIAGSWGFRSTEKRGDEQGEQWEILRETCGLKGMVLDRVELMEGME